ncbi:MAG: type II toxin-antitoxin system VapC family toxin [Oscillospiraceae bacterium]|nr:type II toxin-antitoxin system VapC family toxin [Oscillospiraceae bacterium]
MIYSLDTNTIIDILKKRGNTGIKTIEVALNHQLVVSPFVFFELYRGFLDTKATAQEKIFAELEKILYYPKLDEIEVMKKAAEIAVSLKKHGTSDHKTDIFIAAWTIEAGAILVTSNIKHFENIHGLPIENWRE